jgi:hypothetical protein
VHALDEDGLVDRVLLAEQRVRRIDTEQRDRALRSTSMALIIRPRSASKFAKSRYSEVTP